MSDNFRVVRITDYRPTMLSTEESGENPSSLSGHFSPHFDDISAAVSRGANLRLSPGPGALNPSIHVAPFEVEKHEQDLKLTLSPHRRLDHAFPQQYLVSVTRTVTEGAEHRVNI
jgi:hypothetical protein